MSTKSTTIQIFILKWTCPSTVSCCWFNMAVFPGMIYNCHRPALNIYCEQGCRLDYTLGMEVPLGKRGNMSLDSTTLRNDECTAWYRTLLLCPARRDQCVGCRRSMVMKPNLWIYPVPTRRRTRNSIIHEHGVGQWNISLCIPSNGNGAKH